MSRHLQVLIACSDAEGRKTLARALAVCDLRPVYAPTVSGVGSVLARGAVSLVFCTPELSDGKFQDVLRVVKESGRDVPVIVASRSADTAQYLEAMRSGAFDYVATPCQRSEVEHVVHNALHRTAAA